uniref:ARAD1C41712p n=1 Tax=Blastobotrys adeninivorans TaxID=409370 RepID=A0A060T977_BLAAD
MDLAFPTPNPNPTVQEIIERRLASFDYLQRVHGGTICWLNTVHLSRRDFDSFNWATERSVVNAAAAAPLNSLHYFYLGGSLQSILDMDFTSLSDYLRALHTLMKEYETLIGAMDSPPKNKIAGVGRRLFRSRMKSGEFSPMGHSGPSSPTESRPRPKSQSLHPQQSTVSSISSTGSEKNYRDFIYLKVFHLPFVPDVYETFLSLCETLTSVYRKLWHLVGSGPVSPEHHEIICKIDDKIRRHLINPTIKDVDALSRNVIYEETTRLDSLLIQAK